MALRRSSYIEPRAAVFFDRDGTLIHDRHYLKDPNDVELVPNAASAVRHINNALIPVVVVTNQSGIARGLLTEADYQHCMDRLYNLLSERSAFIDAEYHCPHHPDVTGPCECRKPGTALFRKAIAELNLDATRCTYIGDRWHDIVAAKTLGGRGILVPMASTPIAEIERAQQELEVAPCITAAVHSIVDFSPPPDAHSVAHTVTARIAVLASGGGTNLQAILDQVAALGTDAPGNVVLVVSDRRSAGALKRARSADIEAVHLPWPDGSAGLARLLAAHSIDVVALAGFLRLVPVEVTRAYHGHIVNIHPALLPEFGGPGMYGHHVHEAVLASGVKESGATVHYVDEEFDRGAIIAQTRVPVEPGDSADTLAARVLAAEHALYPRVLMELCARSVRPAKS